jgi:hypothetical protein
LKQELEKSKKKSKVKPSVFATHDLSPAELKYRSNISPNYRDTHEIYTPPKN